MIRRASAPTLLLIALILVSISLAGSGFYLLQRERAKNIELQDKIDELNTKQRITEAKLKESEKLISDLQFKLQEAQTQVESLSSELQQERSTKEEATSKIEQLTADLTQQKGLRADLEKKLAELQDNVKNTQAQLKALEAQKAELEAKVKEMGSPAPQGVELGKIMVAPEGAKGKEKPVKAAKGPAALEGKVLVINKDYNFAVINLGSKDGVELGSEFSIYHNNKYLGDIKVKKIHETMSAAGFVSPDLKNKVNEGDKVVQKGK